MKKVILIYSGGLDSTVLLYQLLAAGDYVKCLSVDYGQRHRKELDAARCFAGRLGIEHRVAGLSGLRPLLAGNSLTTDELLVPEGHYTDESMKLTIVPNRNMVMLAVAAAWAISTKADAVAYAAQAGGHTIYPDCREAFIDAMRQAFHLADWHEVGLMAPFSHYTKKEIVLIGQHLSVPFGETWSCYKGGAFHCGKCGTCVKRREAFDQAQVPDPTEYER